MCKSFFFFSFDTTGKSSTSPGLKGKYQFVYNFANTLNEIL